MEKTIIQLDKATVERLKQRKKYARQTYDEIIGELLVDKDDEPLTAAELRELRAGLEDLRKGRVKPIEQLAHELGVKLK
jgi:predicted transcriptional regulator